MPNYKLELSNRSEQVLNRMASHEPAIYQRVSQALDDLEVNPFQGKPLKGKLTGRYSYRIGNYRIIYLIRRRELIILVIDIGHRRDIYP